MTRDPQTLVTNWQAAWGWTSTMRPAELIEFLYPPEGAATMERDLTETIREKVEAEFQTDQWQAGFDALRAQDDADLGPDPFDAPVPERAPTLTIEQTRDLARDLEQSITARMEMGARRQRLEAMVRAMVGGYVSSEMIESDDEEQARRAGWIVDAAQALLAEVDRRFDVTSSA